VPEPRAHSHANGQPHPHAPPPPPPPHPGSPTDTPTAPAELYVHGLVYDAADGPTHPVPTARVRVSPCVGAHQPFEDTSGDDGTYSVVLPGMYFFPGCTAHFEVIASGYVTGSWDIGYSDLISLPERDFGLQPEGQPTATPTQGPTNVEVHGLVYDAGQGPAWPIAGAQVVVPPCSTPHQSFSAVTGADGLYSLVLPAPYFELGCTLHFDVRAAGYQPLSVDVLYDDVVADPVRDFALAPEVGGRLYLPALQKGSQ
jgi:hypothetical protein